ncbi:uncharacterized protein LOC135922970 isoform X2 [Gordionus sp. m RMFG-2023]|uniref:uncharacterized protein LOC135922970 isoform X2 n=1 Tax=Gordionus sp. m RMFG-2023 TaxID=3053472 RepID=UPI0031FBC4FE
MGSYNELPNKENLHKINGSLKPKNSIKVTSPFKIFGDRFIPCRTGLDWNLKSGIYNDLWSTPKKRQKISHPTTFSGRKAWRPSYITSTSDSSLSVRRLSDNFNNMDGNTNNANNDDENNVNNSECISNEQDDLISLQDMEIFPLDCDGISTPTHSFWNPPVKEDLSIHSNGFQTLQQETEPSQLSEKGTKTKEFCDIFKTPDNPILPAAPKRVCPFRDEDTDLMQKLVAISESTEQLPLASPDDTLMNSLCSASRRLRFEIDASQNPIKHTMTDDKLDHFEDNNGDDINKGIEHGLTLSQENITDLATIFERSVKRAYPFPVGDVVSTHHDNSDISSELIEPAGTVIHRGVFHSRRRCHIVSPRHLDGDGGLEPSSSPLQYRSGGVAINQRYSSALENEILGSAFNDRMGHGADQNLLFLLGSFRTGIHHSRTLVYERDIAGGAGGLEVPHYMVPGATDRYRPILLLPGSGNGGNQIHSDGCTELSMANYTRCSADVDLVDLYVSPLKSAFRPNESGMGSGLFNGKSMFIIKNETKLMPGISHDDSFDYSPRKLFRFTPRKDNPIKVSPLSLSNLTVDTESLMSSPRKCFRKIPSMPYKILDAPDLQDDFYLNLVDWSDSNILAVGLGSCVYLWNAITSQVTKLCDLSHEVRFSLLPSRSSIMYYSSSNPSRDSAEPALHASTPLHSTRESQYVNDGAENRSTPLPGFTGNVMDDSTLEGGNNDFNRLDSDKVTSVSWSRGWGHPAFLAIGTHQGRVHVWDASALKQVLCYPRVHKGRIGALAWRDANSLCTGSRDRDICHLDTRVPVPSPENDNKSDWKKMLTGHKQEVCGMKWSPDNVHLATGGNDNKLLLWDLRQAVTPLREYTEHTAAVKAITWNPHQRGSLVSGGGTADRSLRFWNTLVAEQGSRLAINTGSQVCNLAWSMAHPDEFVSTHGYSQNQIVIWKYPSLSQMTVLTGHSYRVLYLALSPDGKSIVTGAGDETLRFWNVFDRNIHKKPEIKSSLNLFSHLR